MKIKIDPIDSKIPNLALLKLSAQAKAQGDQVVLEGSADLTFASKVFTYTPLRQISEPHVIGGFGYDPDMTLDETSEHICPDYDLYAMDYSIGFTTRGCIRNCEWCIVPKKEGAIKAHAEVSEFLRHDKLLLLDNNILAHRHGRKQLEIIAKKSIKLDCNQGLDARLIDDSLAKLLASIKWWKQLRISCDTSSMTSYVYTATRRLRRYNIRPMKLFCYVLVRDIQEAMEIVMFLKGLYIDPFAQPYRDIMGTPPTFEQRAFARWVNIKPAFNSMSYKKYCELYVDWDNQKLLSKPRN